MSRLLFCLVFVTGFVASAIAADTDEYYISPRTGIDMLENAKRDAATVSHLPRLTPVVPLRKQRSWQKIEVTVKHQTLKGWVPEGAIRKRYQASDIEKKKSMFSGISSLFRSPADTRKTAVLGARGLEEEGALLKPAGGVDKNMVRWMEGLHVNDSEVAAFILEGDLNP